MHPLSIFLATLVAFSALLASTLAEPIPKSEAVQAAEAREVDAIGPPWHSEELCCRPGCTWCGYEPCSINNCNMPVSFVSYFPTPSHTVIFHKLSEELGNV